MKSGGMDRQTAGLAGKGLDQLGVVLERIESFDGVLYMLAPLSLKEDDDVSEGVWCAGVTERLGDKSQSEKGFMIQDLDNV